MSLTENERHVYALVRAAAKNGDRLTISEAAERTGMARSSVARVAEKLGYRGWVDLTTQLVQYYENLSGKGGLVSESVEVVVSALKRNADKVLLVDGVGDAEICVDYSLSRFGEVGFTVMPYGLGVAESIAGRGMAGVFIAFNESGMTLMPACLQASDLGFEVIAITASHDTPISKLSDINVVIKNNKSNLTSYEPNYFTAGVMVLLERILTSYKEAR